ncbi:MAG: acetate--CoA ligase family protein [Nanoarchaeota archaeon]|nr:acetate--CoA ligase family protein [Nanoarchaeota archaeon]
MLGVIDSFNIVKNLPIAKFKIITKHEDLETFNFPYYLKADVIGHKTELGAVVQCNNLEDSEKKLRKMHKTFPKNKIIAQEIAEGIEMIVGIKDDAVFGKLLVIGFGGIFAEVQRDVSFRALPVSRLDVISMVQNLKGSKIFNARGKKYNLEKFYTLVEKVAHLADRNNIKELDLNPVVVGENGSFIVDARVELESN